MDDRLLYGVLWSHGACHAADSRELTALCGLRVAYISSWSEKRMGLGYGHRGVEWSAVTCTRCRRRPAYRRWADTTTHGRTVLVKND